MDDKRLESLLRNVPTRRTLLDGNADDRYREYNKRGANYGMVNNEILDIWANQIIYDYPTAPFEIEAVSTSNDDDENGNGAQLIKVPAISYPDFKEIDVFIFLNGTLAVSNIFKLINGVMTLSVDPVLLFRVNDAEIVNSGSYSTTTSDDHVGDITIQTKGGGLVHATIIRRHVNTSTPISLCNSVLSRHSIPINATGYVQNVIINSQNVKPITVYFFERERYDLVAAPFRSKKLVFSTPMVAGSFPKYLENAKEIKPLTDIWFCGIAEVAGNSELTIDYELTLRFD